MLVAVSGRWTLAKRFAHAMLATAVLFVHGLVSRKKIISN
jgi:hypothetical protein